MRKSWSQIFAAVPGLEAELRGLAIEGDTAWAEWEWRGARVDGAPPVMRGVTVQGVRDNQLTWARLYMEPVQVGAGINDAVRGVDTVITTATPAKRGGDDNPQTVDVEGNRNLVDAAKSAGVGRFLFFSFNRADPNSPNPFSSGRGRTAEYLKSSHFPTMRGYLYYCKQAPLAIGPRG